ncbi:MAG TPA: acetoacetyl-CoA reductase [Dokdonella sp.]
MARVAIVTGGTRGIGRAIAQALRDDGRLVAAVYHGNDEAAADFRRETGIAAYRWDVADFDACRDGVARVEADLGAIDILVNNAGIARDVTLHKMTREQWQDVLRTNLDSLFNMCRHVVEGMRERRFGRIVNLSSINGQKGQVGQTHYAASKAGVLGFTRSLALEGAHRNVTANAIAPGYCDTDMVAAVPADIVRSIVAAIPVGRLGRPEEIARIAAFLARDEAGFITGTTFSVNGGQWTG